MSAWQFPNTATPPGSAAYYVARFAEPAERDRIAGWLAWFAHLDAIAAKANDPGVARLKLDWWREEAKRMQQNQARHPLAEAVAAYVRHHWQTDQMWRALDAIEQRILKQTPADLPAFQQQCTQEHGSRFILLTDQADPDLQNQAAWLGGYHAMVMRLQHLGKDIQQHYLSLPAAFLQRYNIQRNQLQQQANLPKLAAAMPTLLDPLERKLLDELPDLRQQTALHSALRMAIQAYYLSRAMRKTAYASHRQWHELTPLQNLWAAWRMR